MKKILVLILIVVMAAGLLSCNGIFDEILGGILGEKGDVSIVIENRDGTYDVYKAYLEDVENKDEGVYGVIQHIMAREKNPLEADIVDSTYGAYINSIGSLIPETSDEYMEYVSIYTSLEKDFGTWDGAGEIDYEGTTLKASGVGLTSMSAEAGTIVLFRIETYAS